MSFDSSPVDLLAAADLSLKLNRFGKHTSTGINVCTVAGERMDGVIGSKPKNLGEGLDFYIERMFPLVLGGTVAEGDQLTTDVNGAGVVATDGQYVGGDRVRGRRRRPGHRSAASACRSARAGLGRIVRRRKPGQQPGHPGAVPLLHVRRSRRCHQRHRHHRQPQDRGPRRHLPQGRWRRCRQHDAGEERRDRDFERDRMRHRQDDHARRHDRRREQHDRAGGTLRLTATRAAGTRTALVTVVCAPRA
jgi:hypothetical protein